MASPNLSSNMSRRVLASLLLLRLLNSTLVWTFFQPDEYFQSLEPAWQAAFGSDSGAYITWEWKHQLRSSLHPVLFAAVYKSVDQLALLASLSEPLRSTLLLWAPKATQAVIAALGDFYTWRLAVKVYGDDSSASTAALWMTALSPWQWYCSVRTFSNSLETTLTVAALNSWPWHLYRPAAVAIKENPKARIATRDVVKSLRFALLLAAIAVLLRPTNLLIWIPIFVLTLRPTLVSAAPTNPSARDIAFLLREVVACGLVALGLSLASDRLYFGFWAFPPYKWLHFNISQALAVFYGQNPWHYYFLQGLPLLCTTLLPFVLLGFYRPEPSASSSSPAPRVLPWTVYTTIAALSLISHKEVRFTYPLLPVLHILGAPKVANFFFASAPSPSSSPTPVRRRLKNKAYLAAGLAVNLLLASYLSLAHQIAPISVLSFLRSEFTRLHPDPHANPPVEGLFVMFLAPCHSTPWRAHLIHSSLTARALSCEPPLHTLPGTPERAFYRDEADRFYDDPALFLSTELWPQPLGGPEDDGSGAGAEVAIPRYIVGFEGVEPWLRDFFAREGRGAGVEMERVWEGWNGFFSEDWRRAGKLVVWDTGLYE